MCVFTNYSITVNNANIYDYNSTRNEREKETGDGGEEKKNKKNISRELLDIRRG